MPELSLYVRLLPAGVLPDVLGFGELLALGELDPDRGQHRPPVADEGAGERGLVAWDKGRTVVPVAREDVVEVRHHSVTARASLKPGVPAKVLRTSSGTGSSTVTAIAAREPGLPPPTAMLPMFMPCLPGAGAAPAGPP